MELAYGKVGGHLIPGNKKDSFLVINNKFISTVQEAQKKISQQSASPLSAEELGVKLKKFQKTENLLRDLIKIFSEVDKNAQLGPQIANLIAKILLSKEATDMTGEKNSHIVSIHIAVMKSVIGFFDREKLLNLYSEKRFSIEKVLDLVKEGLLLEKEINIPGKKIAVEIEARIILIIALYIEAVDNAKNNIKNQGNAFVASSLSGPSALSQEGVIKRGGIDFTDSTMLKAIRIEPLGDFKDLGKISSPLSQVEMRKFEADGELEKITNMVDNGYEPAPDKIERLNQYLAACYLNGRAVNSDVQELPAKLYRLEEIYSPLKESPVCLRQLTVLAEMSLRN